MDTVQGTEKYGFYVAFDTATGKLQVLRSEITSYAGFIENIRMMNTLDKDVFVFPWRGILGSSYAETGLLH